MKRNRLLLISLMLALLTGCTPSSASIVPIQAPDAVVAPVIPKRSGDSNAGYSAFSAELLRRCRAEGRNTLLSPLSVTLALGMTSNGAGGNTLAEFEALFGMDLTALNSACAAMLENYQALGGATEATLVNSLWADESLVLDPSFTQRCMTTYDAALFQADLQAAETVTALNRWVNEHTHGLIPSVVDKFSPSAVLALVNATYLKNQFERPFETPATDWTLTFTAEDGTLSHPKGMYNGSRTESYMETDDARGVLLPYDDGQLGLLLMLPDDGITLTDYLLNWDGHTISDLLAARRDAPVDLTIPKFKVEWSKSLADILSGMGLDDACSLENANFQLMGTVKTGNTIFINDVIHKTSIEVNEKGTEAAAVTAVIMDAGGAMPQPEVITLTFDRPFLYAIVDLAHGTPLFLGTLETI